MKEFRNFILRGNVVDLAVAVAVGAAFTAVINQFVKSFITPLIGAIFGHSNHGKNAFSSLVFSINGSTFSYGDFITAAITFLITATVVFFVVVKPSQALLRRFGMTPAEPPPKASCPECLTEIPVAATRCAACTAELGSSWAPVDEVSPA